MRNALKWMLFSQAIALPAWAGDPPSESCSEMLKAAGIAVYTDGERDVWVDVTPFSGLTRHVGVFADPPSEADPPTEYSGDPPTESAGDPPTELGAQVLVDLSADGQTLTVYLADPPDPDLGTADPPDPDADPPDPDADPPDPDHQIRIVVDQASIGSLTFVDSMGLPLILVGGR